jgi:hypothetical protein
MDANNDNQQANLLDLQNSMEEASIATVDAKGKLR